MLRRPSRGSAGLAAKREIIGQRLTAVLGEECGYAGGGVGSGARQRILGEAVSDPRQDFKGAGFTSTETVGLESQGLAERHRVIGVAMQQ